MANKVYTDEQRIERVWDVLEIRNIMARYTYLNSYNQGIEALALWVEKPKNRETASYGDNLGYQSGMGLIEKNVKAAAARPEFQGKGQMGMSLLTSPYVEIAGDGQTAQGLWYAPGQVTATYGERTDAMWVYGRYGADFILEDGQWKIWHLFFGTDFAFEAGSSYKGVPVDENPQVREYFFKPELSYEFEAYTARYNYALYPAIPLPYETFADEQVLSNGIEGNPIFKREGK